MFTVQLNWVSREQNSLTKIGSFCTTNSRNNTLVFFLYDFTHHSTTVQAVVGVVGLSRLSSNAATRQTARASGDQ